MELTKERMLEIAKSRKNCEFCFDYEKCDSCEKAKQIRRDDLWEFYGRVIELLQADAEGQLMKLMCSVGDMVYVFLPKHNYFIKAQIKKIEIKHTVYGEMCYFIEPVSRRGFLYRYFENDFGKTVFFPLGAAQEALKKMRGDENA